MSEVFFVANERKIVIKVKNSHFMRIFNRACCTYNVYYSELSCI